MSNEAYHELSMLSNPPSISKIQKLSKSLNSQFDISVSPNNIIGVQQNVKARILQLLTILVNKTLKKELILHLQYIKLTGDGTQIGRGLNVANIAFTIIIDEGKELNLHLGTIAL